MIFQLNSSIRKRQHLDFWIIQRQRAQFDPIWQPSDLISQIQLQHLLLLPLAGARVSESLGEWIVVYLQLRYLQLKSHNINYNCSIVVEVVDPRTTNWSVLCRHAPSRSDRRSPQWTRSPWTHTSGTSNMVILGCRWLAPNGTSAGTCASNSIWSAKRDREKKNEWSRGQLIDRHRHISNRHRF